MAPPIAIESEEHLQRLVQENDKLIAGWFPVGEDGDPTSEKAFEQLPAAAEGGFALLCRIDPVSIPAANLLPDGWETSEGDQQEPCCFFYSAGKMVRSNAYYTGWRYRGESIVVHKSASSTPSSGPDAHRAPGFLARRVLVVCIAGWYPLAQAGVTLVPAPHDSGQSLK